ncbi:rRNA pseudouridine synthase [Candidatus Woesearchaeota archaeon]|nr:rRNA pseudouridine synthase [Candidatus Woesearchaeota archaeon]
MERVQKILAQAGVASRRKCEELIAKGRVSVNGKIVKLGDKASEKDKILVNGKPVVLEKKVYVMLNKPKGVVTTVSEGFGMKTVLDLVKVPERVFPVGRLDKNTEGLLLLTNDGDLANKLTHPRYEVQKEYFVVLNKPLSEKVMLKLQEGVVIDGRKVDFSRLDFAGREVFLRIHEGRKHIVRRLFELLGFRVLRLVRTRVGSLDLGDLKPGKWRFLTPSELSRLIPKRL